MPQNEPQPEYTEDTTQTAERRDWIRFSPRSLEVTWQCLGGDGQWEVADVQDISARGIGLVITRALYVGAVLNVRLNPYDLRQKAVMVRIKHIVRLDGDRYQIGGTFVVPLTSDQLQELVARG
jgi:hypothetical protein